MPEKLTINIDENYIIEKDEYDDDEIDDFAWLRNKELDPPQHLRLTIFSCATCCYLHRPMQTIKTNRLEILAYCERPHGPIFSNPHQVSEYVCHNRQGKYKIS